MDEPRRSEETPLPARGHLALGTRSKETGADPPVSFWLAGFLSIDLHELRGRIGGGVRLHA